MSEWHRITVAGVTGAGKSTLARRIGAILALPYTELDALHHGPGWQPRPEFLADVERLVAGEAWITEWQYASARPLIAARAELLVWLDLPYPLTFTRVVRRTVRRRVRREELWNGNQEPPLRTILTDPEHVIRWSVRTRGKPAELVARAAIDHPGLEIVRLRSQRAVERWLGALAE